MTARLVPATYLPRIVDRELDELLGGLGAIALDGAKAVGKTATAAGRAGRVYVRDDPAERAIAAADPARLLEADRPILLDEWHGVPEVWDLVRREVDAGAAPGSFLLAGSKTPADDRGTPQTHSGAGRIVSV